MTPSPQPSEPATAAPRSAALAVLCVIASSIGSGLTFLSVGGYLGKNYGSNQYDGVGGLAVGCMGGFAVGLVLSAWRVRSLTNAQRWRVIGITLAIGAASFGVIAYDVANTPLR